MKTTLITGINGLVGSNLARRLLAEGCAVRGLIRSSSDRRSIDGLDVELIEGDIRDERSVARAVFGVDTVFHTAAMISHWRRERDLMFAINIGGTHNVVRASIQAGVRRFIHTSSIAALPFRPSGEIITEETQHDGNFLDVGYRIAKYRSEQIVLDAVKSGLAVVVLNPSIIMGPGDYRFHGGRVIKDVHSGRIFYAPPGGSSIAHVDDVVQAHWAAARTGRTGERYILAGENLPFREVFRITAEVVGGTPPLFTIPAPIVKLFAGAIEGIGGIFGTRPWVTRELTAGIEVTKQYSSAKAARDLGFTPRGIRETIQHTFDWYKTQGLL